MGLANADSLPSLPLSIFVSVVLSGGLRETQGGLPAGLRAVTGDTDTVQQHLVFNGGVFGQTRAAIRRLASVSSPSAFLPVQCMQFMHRTLGIMHFAHLSYRHYTGKVRASQDKEVYHVRCWL